MIAKALMTVGAAALAALAAALQPALAAPSSAAATQILDEQGALTASQAAIGGQVEDYHFIDSDGNPVRLSDYRGKPLIVNLIYTACIDSCPVIVQTLSDAVEDAQGALDADRFNIVTIGFDTRSDKPHRMRSFARSQGIDLPNWKFLSGDGETIEKLAKQLGYVYYASARGFQHLSQISILDSQGILYRQVYGEYFDSPFLVEPLKDLVFGRNSDPLTVEGLVNRLRLFCTLYDPAAQRYRFDYSVFIGLTIGSVALLIVGSILVRNIWRRRHGGWLSIRH